MKNVKYTARLLLCIALVFSMVFSITACNKTGGGSAEKATWDVVEKVDAPAKASGTLTQTDFEAAYRPYTDWRIYEIRTTQSDIKPAEGGTAYYVSNNGNDSNDGLTPETAVTSYTAVMGRGLKSGDVIYFERGSEFRGTITVNTEGITFAAYGEGKAPVFRSHFESGAGEDAWEATDAENVYVYKNRITEDVGQIVFDDTYYTYKSFYTKDDVSNSKAKKYVNSYKDLKEDLQLYHDLTKKYVYVYSSEGNPGERFSSIEFGTAAAAFKIYANNVTVDGLCIKNSGFGISAAAKDGTNTIRGLTVQNCEFGWIGGYSRGSDNERLGNGIEIWGGAVDFIAKNNYFYQIYDAGLTFQFSSTTERAEVNNVQFCNNVFDYCNYSIEYFMTIPGDEEMKDFVIDGNLCWYAGEGLCAQRPDRSGCNHIKSWGHNNGLSNPIKVTNNLFALGFRQLCETLDNTNIGAAYDNNIYVQTEDKRVAINAQMEDYFKMDENVKLNIEQYLGDKNATIITISK